MAYYNELNALIDAYINRNGVQAITGQILNGVLKAMVEQLGRGYTIMGAAIPMTDPGTPDGPECYFASETGTYTDFGGLQVVPGELALLCYTPTDGWTKATIYEGFQEVGATIDGNVGTPSVGVSYADGVLSFDFHNMKGNPGQNGQDGAAAGFGTIGADITGGVGTPAVTVESSGQATAKNLQFHFTNLKGETGVTSVVATVDNTTGTPACTVSLVGQQLTLAFSGLKGAQGDTGSSVDYPFTIVNNLTTDDATQALSAAQGVALDNKVSQLRQKVYESQNTQDAEVHQVNVGDSVDTTSGTRLRLLYYVKPGYMISASCSLGSGVAAGVYSSKSLALVASGDNPLQAIQISYAESFNQTTITVEGYLCISLKKTDGSSFSAQEKADFLAATNVALLTTPLPEAVKELQKELQNAVEDSSQTVGIIEANIGDVPPAQMSNDLKYSKENSTFWDSYSASAPYEVNYNNSPFFVDSKKQGLVTSFTALFFSTGNLTIGKVKKTDVIPGQAFDLSKLLIRRVYNIASTGEQTVSIEPFFIDDTEMFAVGATTDTAKFQFGGNVGDGGFKYVSNGIVSSSSNRLGITFNGFTYIFNSTKVVENGFLTSEIIQDIVGLKVVDGKLYNGYSSLNASPSNPNTAPFVIIKANNRKFLVKSITLRIHTIGVLTIGKIKRSDAVVGDNYDRSKVFDKLLLTFTATGEQTMNVPTTWNNEVKTDEYIVVGDTTDTAIFYYGGNSPRDTGFIYCATDGKWALSASSIGFDINVTFIESSNNIVSTYKDKRISILGDSISTFAGYIPEGNATYYPAGTVQSVQDTWWKKLIDALGLVLDTNNSWSGSRVTTTGGEASAGCMTRAQSLGTPDVIIVWMGINDFNNEVALGTYDGKSEIPTATTTFREAYGIMLNKILTAYPSAEVWVCTLPQCERNGTTGFPEVNGNGVALLDFNIAIEELARAFGVKVLDHNRCGLTYQNMSVFNPDQLHPNKYGHSLVANNDIRQMDNCVSTRYAIAE